MKRNTFYLLAVMLIWQLNLQAQKTSFICSYYGNPKYSKTEICSALSFTSNNEAEKVVDNILSEVGLKRNFIVMECPNTENCYAVTLPSDIGLIRYIIYDNIFLNNIKNKTRTDWASISILAHEVAHHLNGHTIDGAGSRPDKELEADEFSGFVLAKLGASLAEAQSAINSLPSDYQSSTHPNKYSRLDAIKKGWEKGHSKKTIIENEISSSPKINKISTKVYSSDLNPAKNDFIINSTGVSFRLKYIAGNSFLMGSNDSIASYDEKPVHLVHVKDFYMGKYEVTNEEFCAFLNEKGNNGTDKENNWLRFTLKDGDNIIKLDDLFKIKEGKERHPVANVSWSGAVAYCVWLSEKTGKRYRLPTEAEWEYAAKANQPYEYAGSDDIEDIAWFLYNSDDDKITYSIGTKKANAFGLYDMTGNIAEWCQDWYDENYYKISTKENPLSLNKESGKKILRGGSTQAKTVYCRNSNRDRIDFNASYSNVGFRVVLEK